jgi:GNAT superfamily N-acetyltransferase
MTLKSYELQVELSIQGRGGGRLLVELLSHLSRIWGMEKVMITVFKSMVLVTPLPSFLSCTFAFALIDVVFSLGNTPAINFYEKCL